ncbi:MAG: cobyrinate a,c-diamide synthase [Actinomycetota bacterium]|nr:cobyrinate a,c-diamide synthase [Actinomycetota bacterium]
MVVAGTASGVGKTTIATGLMAALRRRGLTVAAAKVGPDFIDPGYHALATGRPGRNLDAWMCGSEAVAPLAARAGAGADLLVVEGVMGLFDGASDDGFTASTAHVATLLGAPIILVVDASAMSRSVAALVHGYATFDPVVRVAGVVLNRVGGDGHERMLREALAPLGLPVLGVLRRDDSWSWRDRHLGLVPVVEQPEAVRRSLDRLATAVEAGCDLDAVVGLGAGAPAGRTVAPPKPRASGRARVAVASGPAFSFVYPDNLEALEQAGAELVPFDPTADAALPEGCSGLYAGGGFPEVFAEALAANAPLLDSVRRRVTTGLVTWAECGGLLWLSRSLDGHRLAGAVDTAATMTQRLTLGYRRARVRTGNPVAPAGAELRGHEFHYSTTTPAGEALELGSRFGSAPAGFASTSLLASYLHVHMGAEPGLAERYVAAATALGAGPVFAGTGPSG